MQTTTLLPEKRLTTRVSSYAAERLTQAAGLVGATVNQFLIQAALEKADRLLENESVVTLTGRESARLLELMENPLPRNDAFLRAQERYEATITNAIVAA